jgi:hypothetical protein
MTSRSVLLKIAAVAAVAIGIASMVENTEEPKAAVSEPIVQRRTEAIQAEPIARQENMREETQKRIIDPFAPRGWLPANVTPAIAPPPPVHVASPAVEPSATVAPVAPALPYSFLGKFDDGGRLVTYLRRGEQTYVVTSGQTLDDTYKVLSVDARQIEFEHLPTGTKQVLSVPPADN